MLEKFILMNKHLNKKRIVILIGVIILIMVSSYLFFKKSDGVPVYYDINTMPNTLDPQTNTDMNGNTIIRNLFLGLTTLDSKNNVVLGSAKNHDISVDGLTHTFTIRDDIFWSDEDNLKVTAYDFEFAFKRLFSSNTMNANSSKFIFIKNGNKILNGALNKNELGVRAINENTIVFDLEYNKSNFLELLTEPSAMPCNENFFNSTNGSYGMSSNSLITNGVFRLLSTDNIGYISVSKNPNYIGDIKNDVSFIKFIFKQNPKEIINRFESKITSAVILNDVSEEYSKNSVTSSNLDMYSLVLNDKSNFLNNANIRTALLSAIDVNAIFKILPFNTQSSNTLLPPNILLNNKEIYKYNELNSSYYDINLARTSLNKGLGELNLTSLNSFNIIIPDNNFYFNIMSSITQMWQKELNIFATITKVNNETFKKDILNKNYDIALIPTINSQDPYVSIDNYINIYGLSINQNLDKDIQINDLIDISNKIYHKKIVLPLFTQKKYFFTNINSIIYHNSFDFIDFRYIRK